MKQKKYSVSVIEDKDTEQFSLSNCTCEKCFSMHLAQVEWTSFKAKTSLQKRMLNVVKNIEKKYLKK
jgi:hypothetical protein|uniref:Uncharacterized protein n=1 Tax=viral metagenome TaxID=1070528 RepID=A0A6C0IZF9_9ZZZZ